MSVVLVDVSNLLHRSHFAFRGLSHDGLPTGATHGFLKTVLALRDQISRRLVFVWDYGIPVEAVPGAEYSPANWRLKVWPGYKSTRTYTEDTRQAQSQMLGIYQALGFLGYASIGFPSLEADDVMGVLAGSGSYPADVLLYSSDRDLYQLLTYDRRVRILVPGKSSAGLWRYKDAAAVEKEFGLAIEHWAAYLALGGDSSDNIKPARGMGPKTAKTLLQPFLRDQLPPKYIPHREAIHKAYSTALLPRSWNDPRIAPYGPFPAKPPHSRQLLPDKAQALKSFSVFCADRGLAELFGLRKSFFEF